MSKHKVTKRDTVIYAQSSVWAYPTISINDTDYYAYMCTESELCCNLIVIYSFMVRRRKHIRKLLLKYHTPDEED